MVHSFMDRNSNLKCIPMGYRVCGQSPFDKDLMSKSPISRYWLFKEGSDLIPDTAFSECVCYSKTQIRKGNITALNHILMCYKR